MVECFCDVLVSEMDSKMLPDLLMHHIRFSILPPNSEKGVWSVYERNAGSCNLLNLQQLLGYVFEICCYCRICSRW